MIVKGDNYVPGIIWFVSNFHFGTHTRDKYLIILKIDEPSELVCYAMATTRVRYGELDYPSHGCNKIRGLTTNFLEADQVIGGRLPRRAASGNNRDGQVPAVREGDRKRVGIG